MKRNQTIIVIFGILIIISALFAGCTTPAANTSVSHPSETTAPVPVMVKITAQPGDNVTVIYTGMFDNGTVFDTNVNSTPITFTLGSPGIIPGFQDAVTGMAVNEEKTVTIPYTKAYGPYRPELVHLLPLMGPLENKTFVVGTYVTITNKTDNSFSVVKILNVTQDTVTWDENNPLAGQDLTFDIKVTDIQKK